MRFLPFPISAVVLAFAVAAQGEPSFVPVFRENFPDAFVLPHGSEFIAYSTNDGPNVPMARSTDLVHWTFVGDPATGKKRDALPKLGRWAKTGFTWAPEVLQVGTNYVLYYTASAVKQKAQCIGAAVASDPYGPFVDNNPEPIVCQVDLGGSIDPDAFRDSDGKLYLYFKNDGNRVGKHSGIWVQELAADGRSTIGAPRELLRDDKVWEQRLIEAPTMVRTASGYQLFFSGGYFGWNPDQSLSPYAIGYANCASATGPCTKAPEDPILHSFHDRQAGCLSGPGHQSLFTVGERSFISFHAWQASRDCRKEGDERELYIAPLFWQDGKPVIGPSLRQ